MEYEFEYEQELQWSMNMSSSCQIGDNMIGDNLIYVKFEFFFVQSLTSHPLPRFPKRLEINKQLQTDCHPACSRHFLPTLAFLFN